MTTDVVTVPASLPLRDLVHDYFFGPGPRKHAAYPVLGKDGQFLGIDHPVPICWNTGWSPPAGRAAVPTRSAPARSSLTI